MPDNSSETPRYGDFSGREPVKPLKADPRTPKERANNSRAELRRLTSAPTTEAMQEIERAKEPKRLVRTLRHPLRGESKPKR